MVAVLVVGVVECSWLTPIIEVKRIIHATRIKSIHKNCTISRNTSL